jgi:hypothetical protein
MALITPLLLLMFIGVVEVGWAIRGYIVLVNADREATRFAARGAYLDFSQTERADIGYDYVAAHALSSISDQLDFDVLSEDPNATLIISHYLVDSGKPCADPPCAASVSDCSTPAQREPDYADDDVIQHPGMEGYEHFSALYGIPRESQINPDELVAELKEQNDAFNCPLNLTDESVPWVPNSVIAVEAWYNQPQLLGVPLVSNYLTDPIPMYAHTVMRIHSGRGVGGGEPSGEPEPLCTDEFVIWANSTTRNETLDWSGSTNMVGGKVHSNNDFKLGGSDNDITDVLEYVSGFDESGSNNTYPDAVDLDGPGDLPIEFDINDYKPGGSAASLAQGEGRYQQISGDLVIDTQGAVLDGLYYVTGDVYLSASDLSGTFTIVAEGLIDVSGSDQADFTPYEDGLLFFSNRTDPSSSPVIKMAGSNNTMRGIVYAPGGMIELSGSVNTFRGSIIGDAVKLNGSDLDMAFENYCP